MSQAAVEALLDWLWPALEAFDPRQPRDPLGRFRSTGSVPKASPASASRPRQRVTIAGSQLKSGDVLDGYEVRAVVPHPKRGGLIADVGDNALIRVGATDVLTVERTPASYKDLSETAKAKVRQVRASLRADGLSPPSNDDIAQQLEFYLTMTGLGRGTEAAASGTSPSLLLEVLRRIGER